MGPASPPAPTSADALLLRFRESGAPGDLGALFDETAPELFRVALATSPDATCAEDALQETFLAVVDAVARFDASRRALPWLLGILQWKVDAVRRRARRAPDPRRVAVPLSADDPASAEAAPDEVARVRAEIEGLEEPYRSVALLRWRYGLTPAEIAHVRGEPPGTTRSLLSRALERLRRTLRALPAVFTGGVGSGEGLAAVRAAVLRHAATAPAGTSASTGAAAGTAAITGGMLMGKKAIGIAALTLAVAGGVWAWRAGRGPGTGSGAGAPPRLAGRAPESGADERGAGALARAPAAPTARAPAAPASLKASGTVVDPEGRPIAGARVVPYPIEPRTTIDPGTLAGGADTGTDGRFAVTIDAERGVVALHASHPTRGVGLLTEVRAGDDVEMELVPPATFVGRVRDAAGKPIEAATVRAAGLLDLLRYSLETSTGPDGSYRLEGVPRPARDGSAVFHLGRLEAVADGYAWTTVAQPASGAVGGGPATVDLVLLRAGEIEVHVTDADDGAPLEGASVVAWDATGETVLIDRRGRQVPLAADGCRTRARARTDAAGLARFPSVSCVPDDPANAPASAATGRIAIAHEGYALAVASLPAVREGANATLTVPLFREATIEGRVVDASSRGVEGVEVGVVVRDPPFALGDRPQSVPDEVRAEEGATTDAHGRYRLLGIPSRGRTPTPATLRARLPGGRFAPGVAGTLETELLGGTVVRPPDLVLGTPEARWLRIRVTDERGAPVAGAMVSVDASSDRTDADGSATVGVRGSSRAPDRPLSVSVEARGFAPAQTPWDGAEGPAIAVTLARGRRLAGRVVEADGTPAAHVPVWLLSESTPPEQALEPDPYALRLRGSDGPFLARPGGPLLCITRTNEAGRFTADGLPAGRAYGVAQGERRVTSSRRDAPRRAVTAAVPTDARDVELRLPVDDSPRTAVVEGTVTDAETGAPVAFTYVRFRRDVSKGGVDSLGLIKPVGPGSFRVTAPYGTWTVKIMAPGYPFTTVEAFEVPDGATTVAFSARLSRGVAVVGTACSADGAPLADGAILVYAVGSGPLGSGAITPSTDAAGAFRSDMSLAPGRYRVVATPKGGDAPTLATEPEAGFEVRVGAREVRLDVRLVPAGFLTLVADDARLPPAPPTEGTGTEEQARFGAGAHLALVSASGALLVDQRGLYRGEGGAFRRLPLAPGAYALRIELPGESPRLESVRVVAGQVVVVHLAGS